MHKIHPGLIHKDLADGRWFTFSLFMQLANVGCDLDRAIRYRKSGDLSESRRAFERALELMDLTISDQKYNNQRRRELIFLRNALADYYHRDDKDDALDNLWYEYFYAYNYAAALERGR